MTTPTALTPTAAAEILGIAPNSLRAAGRSGEGITLGGRIIHPAIVGCRQSWPAAPILAWAEGRETE